MTCAQRAALARLVWCPFCDAVPGMPCTDAGQHFARYLHAARQGLLGRADMGVVCQTLRVVSGGKVVAEVPPPRPAP